MPTRIRPDPEADQATILTEIARWPGGLPLDVGVPVQRLDALAEAGFVDRRYVITFRGVQMLSPLERGAFALSQALPEKTGLWIGGSEHIVPRRVAQEFRFLTHRLVSMTEQAARYHAELVALRRKVGDGDVRPLKRGRVK